jgi:hypothetical protein
MALKSAVTTDGTFDVIPAQWEGIPNHCGIDATQVRFHVHVEGTLDARGFVIDVRDPRDYFNRLYVEQRRPLPSCETIANEAALHFARGKHVTRVQVDIQASAYGFASAIWTAPSER